MKTIIYGVGKGYFDFFDISTFLERCFIDMSIEVVGFSDGNEKIWGKEIIYNGQIFTVSGIDEFRFTNIEKIIVTSKKYFDEIRKELICKGFRKDQILLIDNLYDVYIRQLFEVWKFEGKTGIEIGGATHLFASIYEKCLSCDNVNFSSSTIWWKNETNDFRYENKILGKVWITDATDMYQIENEKYDFLLSSNNLEHIANPLKALKEFARVVKTGGIVFIIVPQKKDTFDHKREYTTFEHLVEDYVNNIEENDLSHLDEIIEKHDYIMDPECGGKKKFIERARKNIENRCLHHHVFDEECLKKALTFSGLKVRDFGDVRGNWFIVGEKGECT